MAEGEKILQLARDQEAEDNMEDFKWAGVNIPAMHLTLKVPHIPGQDSSMLDKMSNRMKAQRKAFHITCDAADVKQVQDLMEIAKSRNLAAPFWGPNVSPSKMIVSKKTKRYGEKTPSWQINAIKSFTREHVNFHESTTTKGFSGLYDIDKNVVCYEDNEESDIAGWFSLRQTLYGWLKMKDGHSLIVEFHQRQAMAHVEVVIPNAPEAETMTEMMDKNVVAYLKFYLIPALSSCVQITSRPALILAWWLSCGDKSST